VHDPCTAYQSPIGASAVWGTCTLTLAGFTSSDLATLLNLVSTVDPDYEVVVVLAMRPGLRWCVHGHRIFIRGELLVGEAGRAIIDAASELLEGVRSGRRPRLIPIEGGQADEPGDELPRFRATGCQ